MESPPDNAGRPLARKLAIGLMIIAALILALLLYERQVRPSTPGSSEPLPKLSTGQVKIGALTPPANIPALPSEPITAAPPARIATEMDKPAVVALAQPIGAATPSTSARPVPSAVAETPTAAEPSMPPPHPTAPPVRLNALPLPPLADLDAALALRQRLREQGLESRLEIRIHVGPLHDRLELRSARQRLIELGLKPGSPERWRAD